MKNRFSAYLEMSRRKDIIATKNGRPAAVLHGVTDDVLEDYLFESDPRFIARIAAARREHERAGGTSRAAVGKDWRSRHGGDARPAAPLDAP